MSYTNDNYIKKERIHSGSYINDNYMFLISPSSESSLTSSSEEDNKEITLDVEEAAVRGAAELV